MTVLRYTIFALVIAVMAGVLYASSAQAQGAPPSDALALDEVPAAPPTMEISAPPPPPQGPTYNPPPPSGKDWGKLPQATREQILNEWKALPEAEREPFIFYRERAMAKLPDSAYSENPYRPDAAEAAASRAEGSSAASGTPAAKDEKSGGILDKLFNKEKSSP